MKKGAVSFTLVTIIAAIVAGMVIIGVIIPSVGNARESQAEDLCKTSVVVRAGTAGKVAGVEVQASPLLCKTLTPKIKKDNGNEVSREVANKMAKCWETFGEGTYEKSVFNSLSIFGSGKGCFTCYVLPVQETRSFKEGRDKVTPEEFSNFLREEKYPAGSERTYLNYFQTAGGPGNVALLLDDEGIKPNEAYAISYKVGTGSCTWCGAIGGGITAGVGVGLMFVPIPGSRILGFGLIAGGTAVTTVNVGTIVIEDLLNEAAIDTIILSDITNPEMDSLVRQSCNFVGDIEGKKLR